MAKDNDESFDPMANQTLSVGDYEQLSGAGFTDEEIRYFGTATYRSKGVDIPQPAIELNEPHWQEALRNRRDLIDQMLGNGWTMEQISKALNRWYEREDEDPYVWIEATYKKGMTKGGTDFNAMIAATAKINKLKRYKKEVQSQRVHVVGIRHNAARRSDVPPHTTYIRTNRTSGFYKTNSNSRNRRNTSRDEE